MTDRSLARNSSYMSNFCKNSLDLQQKHSPKTDNTSGLKKLNFQGSKNPDSYITLKVRRAFVIKKIFL